MNRQALLALPNVLSLSRLVLAVAFPLVHETTARIALVCAAAISDFLDGFLARRLHRATRWGALIDPIADRAFALTAVTTLLLDGALTTVQYFVIISRDLMTALGFVVARMVRRLRAVPFKARRLGKVVTSLQFVTFLAALARPSWVDPLVVAVGVASVWAIADYTNFLWRARARPAAG